MTSESNHASPYDVAPAQFNLSTKMAFGAGDMGAGITSNLIAFSFLIFLTEVAGLQPLAAGTVLLIGKIWDAINDPMVGYLSDRTQTRWGRRYPWIFAGAIPFGITFFLMWLSPDWEDSAKFWYYVLTSVLFQVFFTVVNLPYTTLTAELTEDYDQRTELTAFRLAFSVFGAILALALGLVVTLVVENQQQQYLLLGGLCAAVSVFPTFWCVLGTYPEARRRNVLHKALASGPAISKTSVWAKLKQAFKRPTFLAIVAICLGVVAVSQLVKLGLIGVGEAWASLLLHLMSVLQTIALTGPLIYLIGYFTTWSFLIVIGIYLFAWLALQITASIIPFYATLWMGLDSYFIPALLVQGTAILMMFVVNWISRRVGKQNAFYIGMGLWLLVQIALFFLQPGQTGLLYGLCILASLGVATAYVVPWAMLPDVIELDELQTGQRREGFFYAFMTLLQKIGLAGGLFLVGLVLETSGFVSEASQQPESALTAIRFFMGPVPLLMLLCGMVLTFFYPITKDAHANIRLQLAERRQTPINPAE